MGTPVHQPPLPCIQPGATVKQAVGVANAATAAITSDVVRIISTTDCYLAFGSTPVATNAAMFLPANSPEYFRFTSGEKIGCIRDAADGNLFITSAV